MTSLKITNVQFGSMLTYTPRGDSEDHRRSREEMRRLKNDQVLTSGSLMSEEVARALSVNLASYSFHDYFHKDVALVPIPSSSRLKKDTLWVPERITSALEKHDLGTNIPLLYRGEPLRRSSTSLAKDRPKAHQHYSSMMIQKPLHDLKEVVLVDDVVTRGATLLGAANKLTDAFPDVRIRAFAVMRTISNPDCFETIRHSCTGNISLRGEDTYRSP